MLRSILLLISCSLLSLPAVSQDLNDAPGASPNQPDTYTSKNPDLHSRRNRASISIVRLRVPRKAQDLFNKAMDAWQKDSPSDAQRNLDRALQLDPEFPDALTLYAGICTAHRDWNSAEEKLQAAIRSDPTFSPAYVILAGVYNTQARFAEAQQATERALSAGANTWEVHYEIARALIGQREFENALAVSDNALRLKQPGCLLHLAKAHALLGLHRYPEGISELKAFLRLQPSGDGCEQARALLEQLEKIPVQ